MVKAVGGSNPTPIFEKIWISVPIEVWVATESTVFISLQGCTALFISPNMYCLCTHHLASAANNIKALRCATILNHPPCTHVFTLRY